MFFIVLFCEQMSIVFFLRLFEVGLLGIITLTFFVFYDTIRIVRLITIEVINKGSLL